MLRPDGVVEGALHPLRAVYALAYGAGLEVSAILGWWTRTLIRAPARCARGTKAWTRDRLARVADWAWPLVHEHLATALPGERVFRGWDRWPSARRTEPDSGRWASRATGSMTLGTPGRCAWPAPAPRLSASPVSSATATWR
ncbi:MAG TPA: hypothetical protein VHR41_18245 [Gemmatimonadales bacterium]|nr:hypothetical protein [Gemmatimonadales bacterium]